MNISKKQIGFLMFSSLAPLVAYSQVYLTEEQALQAIFPGEKFTRVTFELTSSEVDSIEKKADEKVRNKSITAWVSKMKNIVFIDQVLGKHEFITLAVGITSAGKVKDIEIMEYRETYGYQVHEETWKKQFEGKDATARLKLGKDIINISGATLSSAHVTDGVRRLLQTYETLKSRI